MKSRVIQDEPKPGERVLNPAQRQASEPRDASSAAGERAPAGHAVSTNSTADPSENPDPKEHQ